MTHVPEGELTVCVFHQLSCDVFLQKTLAIAFTFIQPVL